MSEEPLTKARMIHGVLREPEALVLKLRVFRFRPLAPVSGERVRERGRAFHDALLCESFFVRV
jgi:hypothetical protein